MLDQPDDIESDFRVFHPYLFASDPLARAEDLLDGPAYFTLAERLPFYSGALRRRAEAEEVLKERGKLDQVERPSAGPAPAGRHSSGTVNKNATRGTMETNSSFSGLVDWD